MHVEKLPLGPLQTNCYLAVCPLTQQAALIDPGWDDEQPFAAAERLGATITLILNTHAHFDHIGGNAAAVRRTGALLVVPAGDLSLLRIKGGADLWGIPLEASPEPDRAVTGGEVLEVGALRFEVLHTPGHTAGHVCYYERAHDVLFDGDVLFSGGIGRADLPGGDFDALMRSIRETILKLPDAVRVFPGHGEATTIGAERESNPWLAR